MIRQRVRFCWETVNVKAIVFTFIIDPSLSSSFFVDIKHRSKHLIYINLQHFNSIINVQQIFHLYNVRTRTNLMSVVAWQSLQYIKSLILRPWLFIKSSRPVLCSISPRKNIDMLSKYKSTKSLPIHCRLKISAFISMSSRSMNWFLKPM